MRTGDLLFFRRHSLSNFFLCLLTGSRWTHCGMIWVRPEGTFLLECGVTDRDNGVQIYPLTEYLARYPGGAYYLRLNLYDESRREAVFRPLEQLFLQTQEVHYDFLLPDILRIVFQAGFPYRAWETDHFVCSTYLAYLYTRLGLLRLTKDWTLIRPHELLKMKGWQGCWLSAAEPL